MFPLNSNDQYIDPNGKRHTLGELFERSEHDIEELEETVSGHTTKIGLLETLTGAIQDQISTDEYSAESDYTEGDYVIHDNKLYKCNTTCTADTWTNNSTYFTETSVADEFTALNSDLNNIGTVYTSSEADSAQPSYSTFTNLKAHVTVPEGRYLLLYSISSVFPSSSIPLRVKTSATGDSLFGNAVYNTTASFESVSGFSVYEASSTTDIYVQGLGEKIYYSNIIAIAL